MFTSNSNPALLAAAVTLLTRRVTRRRLFLLSRCQLPSKYLSAHKSPSLRLEDLRQRHRVHLLLIIFSFAQSNQRLQVLGVSYIYCVRSNASRLCRQRYCSKLSAMRITHWLSCHVGLDQTIETGCARALPTHRYLIMRQLVFGVRVHSGLTTVSEKHPPDIKTKRIGKYERNTSSATAQDSNVGNLKPGTHLDFCGCCGI